MHWAVAVLWAGNNVNNEANATEVCTDDSSGTNSQKPITKVVTSTTPLMKKSTDPYDKLRSALGDKPLPKGGTLSTNRTVSSAGF
jgi:hypothetical protein